MNRQQAPYEVFYVRCFCGPKLNREQFEKMAQEALTKECKGVLSSTYADWDESKPLSWDTDSWSTDSLFSPLPESVRSYLGFYAHQWVMRNIPFEGKLNLDDYVTFKTVTTIIKKEENTK